MDQRFASSFDEPSSNTRALSRRRLLGAATTPLLLPVVPRIAMAAQLLAVRTWPADDYTRVTLELDSELRAEHFTLENPHRMVVDIQGMDVNPALNELVRKVRPDDPYIRSLRVAQNRANVVRIVFDLKQAIAPQVFTLKPVGNYKFRLVLDLYPKNAQDPLAALLKKNPQKMEEDPLARILEDIGRNPKGTGMAPAPVIPNSIAPPLEAKVAPQPNNRRGRTITVALDPGHGGEDPGATGPSGTREKDVVLKIAHRLRDRINNTVIKTKQGNLPMRAYLTRDADYFVPLQQRVEKARRVQADLFISLHADAFQTPQAKGASVFALSDGAASSAAAKWMAKQENRADLIGGLNIKSQDAAVQRALLDMSTTAQIKDSLKLGSAMLGQIKHIGKLHKGRVEQAGFAVLKAPDIPSVLVETAFISNPEEEQRLVSAHYQNDLADALMKGIERYFSRNPPLAKTRNT